MRPFSKSEALQGKPVVTRNGKKVKYITEIPLDINYPVVAVVEGIDEPHVFTSDGKFLKSDNNHLYDLFMGSTKKEGWIAFGTDKRRYSNGDITGFATHVWSTEAEAKRLYLQGNDTESVVHTVHVSWEE